MGGAFALIFGIIGLAIALGMGDKGDKTIKSIKRLDEIEDSNLYYNQELQDKLEWRDNHILEELSGMNYQDIEKELYEKHGGCVHDPAKHTMIKKIVRDFGYDYKLMLNHSLRRHLKNTGKGGGYDEDSAYYNL